MKNRLICALGILAALLPAIPAYAVMPSLRKDNCLFYYEFQGEMPEQGYPDLSGNLGPIKPNGNVSVSENGNLLLDGKTAWFTIPGSEKLELPENTLIAYVKLNSDNTQKNTPGSCDAFFFRKYELTYGRNRDMFFCDNRGVISGPKWTAPVGTPVLCTVTFDKIQDGASQFTLYLGDKQSNWPKNTPIRARHAEAAKMPLEFGRNPWDKNWFLNGEVIMIAMYKGRLTPKELKEFQEHLKYGEAPSLLGTTGDFTADFFMTPNRWDATAEQDVVLAYITLGGVPYALVKKGGEQFLTLGNAIRMPIHSMVKMEGGNLNRPAVSGRHIIFRRQNGRLQLFVDGFPAEGEIEVGNASFQGIFLNRENGKVDRIHYFRNARGDKELRELFRMRVPR